MEPDKRANILYAAGQVFARRGFKKAPIDEIARVAGVAKGTIYLAVSSKEELYERAVALALEVWLAANHLPASAETDLGPLLGALLTDEVASAADHPLVAALLTGQVAAALPGWEDPIEALRRRARANVLELLRPPAPRPRPRGGRRAAPGSRGGDAALSQPRRGPRGRPLPPLGHRRLGSGRGA